MCRFLPQGERHITSRFSRGENQSDGRQVSAQVRMYELRLLFSIIRGSMLELNDNFLSTWSSSVTNIECWLTNEQVEWLTEPLTDSVSVWLTDWLTDWVSDWLTDWPSLWLTDWLSDWLTECLNDWLPTDWRSACLTDWVSYWVDNVNWPP